jgi:hypothetical protein
MNKKTIAKAVAPIFDMAADRAGSRINLAISPDPSAALGREEFTCNNSGDTFGKRNRTLGT